NRDIVISSLLVRLCLLIYLCLSLDFVFLFTSLHLHFVHSYPLENLLSLTLSLISEELNIVLNTSCATEINSVSSFFFKSFIIAFISIFDIILGILPVN